MKGSISCDPFIDFVGNKRKHRYSSLAEDGEIYYWDEDTMDDTAAIEKLSKLIGNQKVKHLNAGGKLYKDSRVIEVNG
ncbi:unnamed protein product [marine sediment metagenome]|uniref:Uncharacterized protein n=1 Tax=marine sediment metagenome TaxID=412755 RepID=X1SSP9_9ZZZZ